MLQKRLYRVKERFSSEDALERNVIASLDAVPLESIRRFAMQSTRYIDAYHNGLNGAQAAWAIKNFMFDHFPSTN
ncbi:hypothetical protein DFJ58DRAFT_798767 [Suillus subalutaceus]|uniref:uncharacterized protein n=1 Tax=Suillus subalutaceus TaxID=48586 RepID=UPI001B85CC38|nr:uncharacterized protein DFJ58DRAFT_798767 [Suillus subalutaceus]KAG1846826.1 hypothetical protein DFJ58DRAFT_798767 [Suillus subalutaceus]